MGPATRKPTVPTMTVKTATARSRVGRVAGSKKMYFTSLPRGTSIQMQPTTRAALGWSIAARATAWAPTANGSVIDKLRLGAHPTDMVWLGGVPPSDEKPAWVARLFVAAANTNNVYVVGVTEAQDLAVIEKSMDARLKNAAKLGALKGQYETLLGTKIVLDKNIIKPKQNVS